MPAWAWFSGRGGIWRLRHCLPRSGFRVGKWGVPNNSLLVNQAPDIILLLPAVALEGSSGLDNRTELVPKCMPEECWCPVANACVPFDAACNPHVCINGSVSGLGLPRARYTLWKEFFFSVPPGPPTQYLVCVLVWACMSLTYYS